MTTQAANIKSVYFKDIIDSDFKWDVVYEDCGVAFCNGVQQFFNQSDIWEVNMVVFVVCLKGHLQFSELNRTVSLRPGDVLIRMPKSLVANCMYSPDFECKVLCMAPELLAKYTTETGFFDKALRIIDNPVINMGYNSDSIRLMQAYETILKIKSTHNEQSNYKIIIANITECLLYEMLNKIPVSNNTESTAHQGVKYSLFNRFMALLMHDKGTLRSVKAYAEALNVSPKYLSFVCRHVSDKTPFDWINDTITHEIEHLLQYTDLSIKEIAVKLNFTDCSFFTKYVRKHLGMAPLQYRLHMRSSSM